VTAEAVIRMTNITKSFSSVRALNNVSFSLTRGEVHALIGQNGAGKSTLIKILAGAIPKDAGEIMIRGENVDINNPRDAQRLGLSVIYQEIGVIPYFDVAENIFLYRQPVGRLNLIDRTGMHAQCKDLLAKLGVEIDTKLNINRLSLAEKQLVMIARALAMKAEVIVLDEPTAPLGIHEVEILFNVLHSLREMGVSIVYISHRLDEIFRISDRVTVLKDGQNVGTQEIKYTEASALIRMMIGKELSDMFPKQKVKIGKEVLAVRGLMRKGYIENVSFNLHEGEILGVFGVIGAGKTELARLIFGADRKESGDLFMKGERMVINNPLHAIQKGIVLVPEDRREQGLMVDMKIRENITLAALERWCSLGIIDLAEEKKSTVKIIKDLSIKTTGPEQIVNYLSGGNQQKVVIAKWLSSRARVIIFDEVTKGVDVEGKAEIFKVMEELVKDSIACIFISCELSEIMSICDRVLVMRKGEAIFESPVEATTAHKVLSLAMGQG
jgi:ABC-type sugar transport system ATPase subunit